MDAHPLAERYPLMDDAEFQVFKEDIRVNGCQNPVWTYRGKILDGRNRYRACRELGREPVYAEFDGTEAEASAFVDSQNLHRRHLTPEQRAQRWAAMRQEGRSFREIASASGVHHTTVIKAVKQVVTNSPPAPPTEIEHEPTDRPKQAGGAGRGDPAQLDGPAPARPAGRAPQAPSPTPPKVIGRDGKQYPATKPPKQQAATPQPKPASKPADQPKTPATETAPVDVAAILARIQEVAAIASSLPNQPREVKPWQVIDSLEAAARSLFKAANRIRKASRM